MRICFNWFSKFKYSTSFFKIFFTLFFFQRFYIQLFYIVNSNLVLISSNASHFSILIFFSFMLLITDGENLIKLTFLFLILFSIKIWSHSFLFGKRRSNPFFGMNQVKCQWFVWYTFLLIPSHAFTTLLFFIFKVVLLMKQRRCFFFIIIFL